MLIEEIMDGRKAQRDNSPKQAPLRRNGQRRTELAANKRNTRRSRSTRRA